MDELADERWTKMIATKPTTISAEELAANLSKILDRTRNDGERFSVIQNGEAVALLGPPSPPAISISELIAKVGNLKMPGDGFADDLEEAMARRRPPKAPEWPD